MDITIWISFGILEKLFGFVMMFALNPGENSANRKIVCFLASQLTAKSRLVPISVLSIPCHVH